MLKKENTPSSTPKPTTKPTAAPAPTQQTVYVPEPTQQPVTYYNVSCKFCKFSGGGYSDATSGSVPAGTKITVSSNYPYSVWWEGSKNTTPYEAASFNSFSYTVNSDCSFHCHDIVN